MEHDQNEIPMLKESRLLPGATSPSMSPLAFFEATRIGDFDYDEHVPQSFGLTDVVPDTISKDGIRLLNQDFNSLNLMNYLYKRRPSDPGRFLVRFDYADLVRGALDHIDLYERDSTGAFRFLFPIPSVEAPEPGLTPAEVERERQAHEAALLKIRSSSQFLLEGIRRGEEAQERIEAAIRARKKRQQNTRHDPMVATPIEATSAPARSHTEDLLARGGAGQASSDSFESTSSEGMASGAGSGRQSTDQLLGGEAGFQEV